LLRYFFIICNGAVFAGEGRKRGSIRAAMSLLRVAEDIRVVQVQEKIASTRGARHVTTRTGNRPECEIEFQRGRSVPIAASVAFTRRSMITR